MAGATNLSLLYQVHGDRGAAALHFKEAVMADIAAEINPVSPVREYGRRKDFNFTVVFSFILDMPGCSLAFGAHGRNDNEREQAAQNKNQGFYSFFHKYVFSPMPYSLRRLQVQVTALAI
jgi:hypothetical protein